MALYGRLFSLVRPSQFYVQIFESRLGRITEIPLYFYGRAEHGILVLTYSKQKFIDGYFNKRTKKCVSISITSKTVCDIENASASKVVGNTGANRIGLNLHFPIVQIPKMMYSKRFKDMQKPKKKNR